MASYLGLEDRTVLITGASRGIGRATARACHAEGAHVVIHYGRASDAAAALAAELGDRTLLVQADLLDMGGAARTWDAAVEWRGRVDVLVNNAGAWVPSPVDDEDAWSAGWQANLALNLQAAADLCRLALLHFRTHGGGILVNVASRAAHRGDDAEHLAYGAAKGGLLALTKGIARGFAKDGVLAYAVAPAWVATELVGDVVTDLAATLPLGDVIQPEDVASVIAFLASGRARQATGATIDITGADYVR